MKNSSLIRTILFNILIILTVLIIYLLFFPKKSYVREKLDKNPNIEKTFNSNINSMKIAGLKFFTDNNSTKVTLQELIDKELLIELKDSNDSKCDLNSYIEKSDNKLVIYLKCPDSENTKEIFLESIEADTNEKLLCIYEYKKQGKEEYTDWSNWSEWSTEKIEKDELTNVEEKIEKEDDGTEIIEKTNEYSIDATYNTKIGCPNGYREQNGICKIREEKNSIDASVSYLCPNGYTRNGLKCYGSTNTLNALAQYYCPSNQGNTEYELSETKCRVFIIKYSQKATIEEYYTCPNGYYLSGNKCYTSNTYKEEVKKTKDVTYYRYQKRSKQESKTEIIWSTKDNQELIDKEYTMDRVITCEF